MKVQRSIEIAATPEKIWSFLVEPEKILRWCITLLPLQRQLELLDRHGRLALAPVLLLEALY